VGDAGEGATVTTAHRIIIEGADAWLMFKHAAGA